MLLALVLTGGLFDAQAAPLPPPDSPPLVRVIEIRFPKQGNTSLVDPQTYLYYIHTAPSRPSANVWVPYDEQSLLDDFKRLWATGFLDDLSIETIDEPYDNGVAGKHVVYNLEERPRVKMVDFEGTTAVGRDAIDSALREANVSIRLDTFVDATLIRKVEGILRGLLKDKGFQLATVRHSIAELPSGPKLIHLTFHLSEGPRLRIKDIDITGNTAIDDGAIKAQMKATPSAHGGCPRSSAARTRIRNHAFPRTPTASCSSTGIVASSMPTSARQSCASWRTTMAAQRAGSRWRYRSSRASATPSARSPSRGTPS
jgi:hypothetical protein